MTYDCPLCGLEFEEANCHSSCPLAKGCLMVRCPRCLYEFVQDGKVASLFRRLFDRRSTRRNDHATSAR